MPRRRRPENKGLPARWRYYHGAYYYLVPNGMEHQWDGKKQFRLGSNLTEAYRCWSVRLELHAEAKSIGELLDRYVLEVVPEKAPKSQANNIAALRRLKPVFGHMPIMGLKPVHVYGYLDKRGKTGRTAANREIEVLSHAYTKAIEWGLTDTHPIKQKVRKLSTPPRTRYIEDWEIVEALSIAPRRQSGSVKMVRAYIKLKLLTGLRRSDLLRLTVTDIKHDGIHVQPHKTAKSTGKKLIFEWTPALRQAIEEALAARPVDIAPWLFCTRRGAAYVKADGSANAWESIWRRFINRVLTETKVTERFTEHDVRAKCASDAASLEHAQQLLAHADSATTKRIYRRRPERVKPTK